MKQTRPLLPVLIAAGTALFIALIGFGSLIGKSISHDQLLAEYLASKSAALLTERMLSASLQAEEGLPEHVHGFALIGFDGTAISGIGIYPRSIDPNLLPEPPGGRGPGIGSEQWIKKDDGLLVLIRSIGGYGARQGRMYAYLGYDTSEIAGSSRSRLILFFLAVFLFLGSSAITLVFYLRVRRYEKELEDSRVLAELGMAARSLAHDLKNPLAVIKMQHGILKRYLSGRSETDDSLAIIAEETDRISTMIDRIRQFLKGPGEENEQLDMEALLMERTERFPFPVQVRTDTGADPPLVWCSRQLLISAIDNILLNGHEAQEQEKEALSVRLSIDGSAVLAEFMDRGPGIPSRDRTRVFHPFFTTKDSGSGVGLAVVRRCADQAHGSVAIEDREGGGTVILLRLPLKKDAADDV